MQAKQTKNPLMLKKKEDQLISQPWLTISNWVTGKEMK